jgi:hypothetical protein
MVKVKIFARFVGDLALQWQEDLRSREIIAERLMELGNLLFISFVATQFLEETPDYSVIKIGVTTNFLCYVIGYNLCRRRI